MKGMLEISRPVRILLVEDNETDVLIAREALKDERLRVDLHVVGNGQDALDFLLRSVEGASGEKPDLVLLDWNLPRKSGWEVLSEMKANEALRRIPVVVLTTSEAQDDVDQAYGLHANSYVTKPLGFEQFRQALRATERFWLQIATLPSKTK